MKKPEIKLDKAPIVIDINNETPAERLAKLRVFLLEETAVHGNSLYARDLRDTISTIENRKW